MSVRFRSVNVFESSVRQLVPDGVPEIQHPMAARRAEKARAVDDVGVAVEDRLQQQRVLARVVLEVRVLDDDDVAGRFAKPARHRRALAAILRLKEHADAVAAVELAMMSRVPSVDPSSTMMISLSTGRSTASTRATISRMVARSL